MGKVELKLEIDADLLARARDAGIEPAAATEAALRSALGDPERAPGLVKSASEKALDPEGAERRAREWAEENRDAIDAHNRHVREHGVYGEDLRLW